MEELVYKSSKGNPVTTSLKVAEVFEKNHKDVLRDIENLTCSQEFRERNFAPSSYQSIQNKKMPMYVMTKDGFTFLAMGYTGNKASVFKEKYIDCFNRMEQAIKSQVSIPQTYAEALELAAKQAREIEAKNKEIKQLEPKASYADRVLEHDNQFVDIGQAAKLLKLPFGRNTFFARLRKDGIFFKNRNEPKQEYSHYFDLRKKEIERDEHPDFTVLKVLVKPRGLFWLSKKYGGQYNTELPALNIQ